MGDDVIDAGWKKKGMAHARLEPVTSVLPAIDDDEEDEERRQILRDLYQLDMQNEDDVTMTSATQNFRHKKRQIQNGKTS